MSTLREWAHRDEARQRQARALLGQVETRIDAMREVLAAHGAREAWLFGSVATGRVRPGSDVDVAVGGCAEGFYRMSAALERALGMRLDVVDLDRAPADWAERIRQGRRFYP